MVCCPWPQGKHDLRIQMKARTANYMQAARFDNGETLPTQHYVLDAQLEDSMLCSQATFLLPSILPEADYRHYAVVLDGCTGVHHVARKGTVVYKHSVTRSRIEKRCASHTPVKKAFESHDKTVEMPVGFEAISEKNYSSMPEFGYFRGEHCDISSIFRSVSAAESIKSLSVVGSSVRDGLENNSLHLDHLRIEMIDQSIIEVGRFAQQSNTMLPGRQSSTEDSTPTFETEDAAFFKSLLTKVDAAGGVVQGQQVLAKPHSEADRVFFKSLLSSPGTVSAAFVAHKSNFKLPTRKTSTLAQKYTLGSSWVNIDQRELAGIPDSLISLSPASIQHHVLYSRSSV